MSKLLLILPLIFTTLFSHSGRTDSSGGHYNRSTGSYHYHNAYKPKNTFKSNELRCGKKRYCYEMVSCSEVMYYFKTCNLYKLDGDRDGIPCEKLCK